MQCVALGERWILAERPKGRSGAAVIFLQMILAYLFLGAALQQGLRVEPFERFNGRAWAGVSLETSEPDLKKQFSTAKTEIADPASVRIRADRDNWMVTAVLSRAGGKGQVVGIAVDARSGGLMDVNSLEGMLGEPTRTRFADMRFDDWRVVEWERRGIAAVVRRGMVNRLLMTDPETLGKNLDAWSAEETLVKAEPLVSASEVEVSTDVNLDDRRAEAVVSAQIYALADQIARRYRGHGWEISRRGTSPVEIEFSFKRKKKDVYEMESRAKLETKTDFGYGSWTGTATESATDPTVAGRRTGRVMERSLDKLGEEIDKWLKQKQWEAEWRPFYALARTASR